MSLCRWGSGVTEGGPVLCRDCVLEEEKTQAEEGGGVPWEDRPAEERRPRGEGGRQLLAEAPQERPGLQKPGESARPCAHLEFRLPASSAVRE